MLFVSGTHAVVKALCVLTNRRAPMECVPWEGEIQEATVRSVNYSTVRLTPESVTLRPFVHLPSVPADNSLYYYGGGIGAAVVIGFAVIRRVRRMRNEGYNPLATGNTAAITPKPKTLTELAQPLVAKTDA